MRIVIYTQCILPYISPRSQRSWNLALNLAKMGHDVVVYAILGNADYSEYESKYKIQFKELGPSFFGCVRSDGKMQTIITRGLRKIFGRAFQFPEIELSWLVSRSLKKELKKQPIDLLITIASPHTIHWGAAKALPDERVKCWVADCGDPFMGNPISKPPKRYERIERDWCSKADAIAIPIENGEGAYYPEFRNKIKVIPQGFDFENIKLSKYEKNPIPTFAFSGAIYKKYRDPSELLKHLCSLDIPFKFVIYTKAPNEYEPYASQLSGKIEFRKYVPREQLVFELSQMDFLVNIKNESSVQQPSKLIDYAQTKRPVMEVSSTFTMDERKQFHDFLIGDYSDQIILPDIDQYDIRNVCQKFIDVCNETRRN